MVLKADQVRVKALLAETITLLCKNGLHFKAKFSIQALIGITLDEEDIFLVNINETIESKDSAPDDNEDSSSLEQQPLMGKRLRSAGTRAASGPSPNPASPGLKSLGGNSSIPKISSNSQTRPARVSRQASPHSVAANRSSEVATRTLPVEASVTTSGGVFGSANDSLAELASDSFPSVTMGLSDSSGGVTVPAVCIKSDSQSNDTTYDESKPLPEESDPTDEPSSKRTRLRSSDVRLKPSVATSSSSEVCANFASSGDHTKAEPADVIEIKEESYSDSESQLPNYSAYNDYNSAMYGGANPDMTHAFGETSMFQGSSGFFVPQSGEGEQTPENLQTWRRSSDVPGGGEAFEDSHSTTASRQCSYCKKLFLCPQSRRNHELRIHQNRYPYVCDICGKGVSSVALLRGHMSSKHNMRKDFRCNVCRAEFGYKHKFKEHLRKHSENLG